VEDWQTVPITDTINGNHDLDLPASNLESEMWENEWEIWAYELEAALGGHREELFDPFEEEITVSH